MLARNRHGASVQNCKSYGDDLRIGKGLHFRVGIAAPSGDTASKFKNWITADVTVSTHITNFNVTNFNVDPS
jgi:hypothetical protein